MAAAHNVAQFEPDGMRMERAFMEHPSQMDQLKAAYLDVTAWDLARFLSATEYDVDQAIERVSQHLDWRKKYVEGVDPAVLEKEAAKEVFLLSGTDKHGHPIIWVEWRKADGGNLFGWRVSTDAIEAKVKFVVSLLERAVSELQPDVHRVLLVINITGVRVDQVDVFLIRQYIMALQANFPERLYRILVVPTGMLVNMFWKTISLLLNERPRHKVVFLSGLPELTSFIDADQIPPPHRSEIVQEEQGEEPPQEGPQGAAPTEA